MEDQIKYTTHKDANVEKIKKVALHEIVHQCHHLFHTDSKQIAWFAEGLALNLANQNKGLQDLDECNFDELRNNFKHYKGSYKFSYTIVNYILNNYSNEEVENLYKNPDYLRENAGRIFEEAKQWIKGRVEKGDER